MGALSRLAGGTPWWAKIGAKLVLSRLPVAYRAWAGAGLFRHGRNDEAAYAYGVFSQHYERVRPEPGFVCLELGPGDALASAVLTRAFGGRGSIQVDVGAFADDRVAPYRALADYCAERGLAAPDLSEAQGLADVRAICAADYRVEGLASLRDLPSGSVDFIYSQSCLEHVRAADFAETAAELRRVLKPGGAASHRVDLRDHLDSALNNLRFSDRVWEAPLMAGSGFYTNRIRMAEMLEIFRRAGFVCEVQEVDRWPAPPTPRASLHGRFRDLPDGELTVHGFGVVCRPA